MNAPTDWISAIAILASGLILGLLFVIFFNKRKGSATLGGEPDLELKDLQAKRDALIQQLRDPGLEPDERKRLETETADVLRQLDGYAPAATAGAASVAADEVAEAPAMNPAVKGFLWGAGSFAALAALAFFVMQSANPREEGGSVTGGVGMGAQQQQAAAQPDPVILQLEAAVQKDPANLQLRNDLAQALLERDNLMGVFEQTKIVLDQAPEDTRALTYQALVRLAMGEKDAAEQMLQRATRSDVKNLDAWVALAWLYAQSDQMKDAEKMIAEAAKQSPENKARLEDVFRQMQAHALEAKNQPAQAAGNELPAGHPPVDGAPAPGAVPPQQAMTTRPPAPADGKSVKVTLELGAGAKASNGVLYVMARNPNGGPPVAVKRLQVSSFPVTFDFGSADSMMGQPLPAKFRLEARLDSDGDAATKPPTDPSAMQNDVAPGAQVRLALK